MDVPLIIDNAAYQDIVIREGNSHVTLLEFWDAENNPIDLTGYDFKIYLYKRSRQQEPDITFEGNDFYIVPTSGSILWKIGGEKTKGKEGVYIYHGDLIDTSTFESLTCLYGKFTIIDKNI